MNKDRREPVNEDKFMTKPLALMFQNFYNCVIRVHPRKN